MPMETDNLLDCVVCLRLPNMGKRGMGGEEGQIVQVQERQEIRTYNLDLHQNRLLVDLR